MIQIRRNPLISVLIPAAGIAIVGAAVYIENYILGAVGGVHIALGVLMQLNPVVVIEKDKVLLKNLIGMTRAEYPHDGLELLDVRADKLHIVHQGQRAPIQRLNKAWLHPGDWNAMIDIFEKAREMAAKAALRR
ncbi:MAG: hypothetical protein AAF570_04980 [Bacteroidota bacterium]